MRCVSSEANLAEHITIPAFQQSKPAHARHKHFCRWSDSEADHTLWANAQMSYSVAGAQEVYLPIIHVPGGTVPPAPIATPVQNAPCPCDAGTLNCSDFTAQPEAQVCYAHCLAETGMDIHRIAEPSLLRILFYPQAYPYLWVEANLRYSFGNYGLDNDGPATARDVYVVVDVSEQLHLYPGADWQQRSTPQAQVAFLATRPLHPKDVTTLCIGSFERQFRNRHVEATEWAIVPNFAPIRLGLSIYAENFSPASIEIEFTPQDIDYEARGGVKEGKPNI